LSKIRAPTSTRPPASGSTKTKRPAKHMNGLGRLGYLS
jgi:hypothetical protein